MHRFPSREARTKPKSSVSPIYSARNRSLSALSVLQPSHLHARASSVVRKFLGGRSSLKGPVLFVDTTDRASCDKSRPFADSTRPETARPRRNTSPTETIGPKDISVPLPHQTGSAPSGTSSSNFTLPVGSLLFSPTPDTPPTDDQDMQSPKSSNDQSAAPKGSPERCDSGYASGQSSTTGSGSALPNASPAMPRIPRTLGRANGAPLTPGGMNMRLSPSVTRSMMPMPILNLPPLPPAPIPDHTLPRTRSFQPGEMRHVKKSMPALMRHGTSNMAMAHAEEDDDDEGSSEDGSNSSDTEEAVATEGDSSLDARDSIDNMDESAERSGSEDTDYFDASEGGVPVTLEDLAQQNPSGLVTPRASEQNNALPVETSALGLQIPLLSGPSTISSSSPWTMVDATPGAARAMNGPSRMDYFSHPVAAARQAFKSPHRTPRVSELISLASPPRVNASTPRATPTSLSPANTIAARRVRAATVLHDPNGESPRPALYQQVSHSMMNLSSPPPPEGIVLNGLDTIRSPLRTPQEGMPSIAGTPGTPIAPAPTPLMRRNSMPTMFRHPPNYNELYPSMPREEEGKEKLPPYSCGIHIEAMMPRKMEFTAPGVLAKDRGWKKQYIVLHGTSLLIYKNDIRKFPIGGKVKGKEKYEGVVTEDEVDLNSPTVHLPSHDPVALRERPSRRTSKRASLSGASESAGSRSSLLSRFHSNPSRAAVVQPQEPAPSDDKASSGHSAVSLSPSPSSSTTKRWSHNQASGSFASSLPHFNPPFSSGNALLRHYTLQRSECGLGSDYYKRRNVIRVRCEGEQFLLQAENVMQVVDWIECLQAGTNVALDLDERPMTKPPPFPRRRRRRRVRPTDGAGTSEATRGTAASGANTNASNDNANR